MDGDALVWYVAYGCDMWSQQIVAQLEGRDLIRNRSLGPACDDPCPPQADRAVFIPYDLYCSGRNRRWGGALPSLGHVRNDQAATLGRAWLINVQQLQHLLQHINNEADLSIDWQQLSQCGHYDARDRGLGRVIDLGQRDEHPMLTFTSPVAMTERRPAAPSEDYLQAWTCGLRECYGLNTVGLRSYFNAIPGIEPALSHGQVQRMLDAALAWSVEGEGPQQSSINPSTS